VIVAYGNMIAMEETLDLALQRVFGGGGMRDLEPRPAEAAQAAAGTELSDRQTVLEALGHYRRAQDYLRQGNWSAFGDELRKTGELLSTFEKRGGKK
jgi:uncharacterized membrane protein (UPF0182 family)